MLTCREIEGVRECSPHVTYPLWVDTQAVGEGIRSAGLGIQMVDVHQEIAGNCLDVVNNRPGLAGDNLRHIAVAVEEPCNAAEGSQPFYLVLVTILYKAHPKDARDKRKEMTEYRQWINSLLTELNIDADIYASYVIGILEDAGQDDEEIQESIAEILSSALVGY